MTAGHTPELGFVVHPENLLGICWEKAPPGGTEQGAKRLAKHEWDN